MSPTSSQRLADLLSESGHHAAAYLVELGEDLAATAIASDLCPVGRTATPHDLALAELVRAWGAGRISMMADALAVWDLRGCATCAHRVLQGLPACDACAEAA